MMHRFVSVAFSAALLSAATLTGSALAQHTLDRPVGQFVDYRLESGDLANPAGVAQVLYSERIEVQDAAWIRLYFSDARLGKGSLVRITSLTDGAVQELDGPALDMWGWTSAYFNGADVLLELIGGPQTGLNRLTLDRVAVEFPSGRPLNDFCGICDDDQRSPSGEEWSGRLLPAGCTSSISMRNSCIVSAGHCMGSNMVVQFRVPPSNPNCSLNHPGPEDQFPVTASRARNSGVGADWAVLTIGTNNLGETAYERYGVYRPIAANPGNINERVDAWGYAVDHNCERNQAQQHSPEGHITSRLSTYYDFILDITFGNSGSGLIRGGEIIGIVTHCRQNCPNIATRVDNADFVQARLDLCGDDELRLADPVPGIAGQENTLTVTGAEPDSLVWLIHGMIPGSTLVPGCPGTFVDIAAPVIAGSTVANGLGEAVFKVHVIGAARGRSVLIQVVDHAPCTVSNLVTFTFQ